MSDPFAVFGLPRRPWLDPLELKELFHRQSALSHADRAGGEEAASALNSAYGILRDSAQRLRALLELEHPEMLGRATDVPPDLAELFMKLATLRRAVSAFVQQRAQAASPLSQALLASESFTLKRDVTREVALLEEVQARCEAQVKQVDEAWGENMSPEWWERLALLQQELAYLGKWSWQLREALFQLEST